MQKAEAIAYARIRIDHIHLYLPHCTPSVQQQSVLSNQILKKNQQRSDTLNDMFL